MTKTEHTVYGVMKMRNVNWKKLIFWVLLAEGVGLASALLTMDGMDYFSDYVTQPPLSPPKWLFPVVWTILYGLMGVSAYLVSETTASRERSRGLNLMVAQLIVNFFWSPFFFNLQSYGFSLLWLIGLWLLVLWMILSFREVDSTAAKLQIPYLLNHRCSL